MARKSSNPRDLARGYYNDVRAGKIVVGELMRKAVERQKNDFDHGPARGLRWVPEKADRVFGFFSMLRHSKGEWAGRQFILSPWQCFLIWVLFGWEREDKTRRFRVAYVSTARKSGKSTLAAGVGLYMFLADQEPGADCVTASTKRDQSRIVHAESIRMVQSSPELKPLVQVFKDNLSIPSRHCAYSPLGADADTLDGLNLSCIIADEVHAWKGRGLWDVLNTATGARRQPLTFAITTAGFDRLSLAYELQQYSQKILDGIIPDDSFCPLIWSLDEGDSWDDPSVWQKANPNIGVSVKLSSLEEECERAKKMPSAVNAFRRLRCNEWTESHSQWLDMAAYDECSRPVPLADLEGRDCIGGLDLATTEDITALVLLFRDDEGNYSVIPYFWVPEDSVATRSKRDRVAYDVWARQGLLETTPGNVTDYDYIQEKIRELAETYRIKEIAYDRWNSSQLVTRLTDDGAIMVPVGMGYKSLHAPVLEFERLVLSRKVAHGGNPVLRWMVSNVSIKQDPAGNKKPDKAASSEKIDGVVALLLALSRYIVTSETGSVYDLTADGTSEGIWIQPEEF
jgi:phage terminase large subunit-like protein